MFNLVLASRYVLFAQKYKRYYVTIKLNLMETESMVVDDVISISPVNE